MDQGWLQGLTTAALRTGRWQFRGVASYGGPLNSALSLLTAEYRTNRLPQKRPRRDRDEMQAVRALG
jgi:hypothetical protein